MFKFGHTPYIEKQIVEHGIACFITNIVFRTSCMSIEPQNVPNLHEHASQGFHVVMGETQLVLVHLPTPAGANYLPI
jgi:hypothetical protein